MASGNVTLAASTTYLILAFTHDGTAGSNTLSLATSSFTSAPTLTQIGSQQDYDSTATPGAHYTAWYTTGGTGTGKFTVSMTRATQAAYVEVIQLGGNNTSAPIITGSEGLANATASAGTSATGNLGGAPTAGDFEVIFQNNVSDQGGSGPTSSQTGITQVTSSYLHSGGGNGASVATLAGSPQQTDTLTLAGSVVWGTMSIEIAHAP